MEPSGQPAQPEPVRIPFSVEVSSSPFGVEGEEKGQTLLSILFIGLEFENGEAIRIISGSFRGYTGSVAEVIPAKSKLKAMINIFGRDTSVEVDFDRVEKIV